LRLLDDNPVDEQPPPVMTSRDRALAEQEMMEQAAQQYACAETVTQTLIGYGLGPFLEKEFPVRECLLSPWLTKQGLAMLYAPRGIGKTFFALNTAYAVATAGEFLQWKADRTWKVVYFDGEMPAITMQERLAGLVAADSRNEITGFENLTIVSQELQEPSMPDLASIDGQRVFDQLTNDADLIIVDNISTLCRAGAENKADDWTVVSDWALRMRKEGRTVLFIHHAGKGGQQRGTSKREDILDVVIALREPLGDKPSGASFEIHFEKARHLFGDDIEPVVATMNDYEWTCEPLADSVYSRIVALHKDGLTNVEIATEVNLHKSNVGRQLNKAENAGDIDPRPKKKSGKKSKKEDSAESGESS